MLIKGVCFRLQSDLPSEAIFLLEDVRLAVNNAVRAGFQTRVTSRNALNKLAYKDFRQEHPGMYSQHLVSAFEVAASTLKIHRRRARSKADIQIPYVKRLMMKAENQAYKLDKNSGVVDVPIRAGCHVKLKLVISQYHRKYLDDATLSLGSLTILPDRVIIALRKEAPTPYAPESIISLDTNESSFDGVCLQGNDTRVVRGSFTEVAVSQQRHHGHS